MLQGNSAGGEAGEVFENRLLGGSIELLFVSNRSCIDGEISAVFYPANGAFANFPCLLKPSFFSDFLREPRKPVWEQDYSRLPPASTLQYPAAVSGNALECDFSAKPLSFPALQAEPTTPTKNGSRLRTGFPSSCKWHPGVYKNPLSCTPRRCIPRRVPPMQLVPSK